MLQVFFSDIYTYGTYFLTYLLALTDSFTDRGDCVFLTGGGLGSPACGTGNPSRISGSVVTVPVTAVTESAGRLGGGLGRSAGSGAGSKNR